MSRVRKYEKMSIYQKIHSFNTRKENQPPNFQDLANKVLDIQKQ